MSSLEIQKNVLLKSGKVPIFDGLLWRGGRNLKTLSYLFEPFEDLIFRTIVSARLKNPEKNFFFNSFFFFFLFNEPKPTLFTTLLFPTIS